MNGNSHSLLIRRVLVIIASAWLPVATMAVPPCCCFLSQILRGSAVAACCCATNDSPDPSSPSGSSPSPSQRRCGCSVEVITAILPAVAALNASVDLSGGWQLHAAQPALHGSLTHADDNCEWFLGLTRSWSATETCVALCRFLC